MEPARPQTNDLAIPPDITLRPFLSADLPFFTSLAQDARVTRHVGDGRPWTTEQIHERTRPALRQDAVHQTGAARWFIAEETGLAVGLFTMTQRGQWVEIGYWVAPPRYWARGVAGAMLDIGAATVTGLLGEHCLSARVSKTNLASTRALTRRGFEHYGHQDGLDVYTRCRA